MCTVLLIWYINKCADHFFPLLFHVITAYTGGKDWFTEPAKCEQTARIWKSTQPITHLASTKQIYNLLNQFLCDLLSSVSTWFVCSLLGHVTTVSPLGKPWKILQFTEQIYLQFTDWMNGSVNCIIFWALFRPHNHRAKLWRSTTKLPLWPIATSTPNTPVALGSSDTSISSVSSVGMVSWQVVRMRTRFFIPSVHFLPPLAFIRLSFGFAAIVRLSFGWFVQLFFGGFATSLLTPPPHLPKWQSQNTFNKLLTFSSILSWVGFSLSHLHSSSTTPGDSSWLLEPYSGISKITLSIWPNLQV